MGFLLLGLVAFLCVVALQRREASHVKRTEREHFERHWSRVVDELTAASMAAGESLEQLGARLAAAARGSPVVWDLWLLRADGSLVLRYNQMPEEACEPYCIGWARGKVFPSPASLDHPAGVCTSLPTGCFFLPVRAEGRYLGTVVFHTLRGWLGEAEGRTAAVAQTALRLGGIFAVFYLGLGGILVVASRKARHWRRRAERAERIQALGAMADGINHEVRNPLNAVALSFQYLQRKGGDAETMEVVESARQQAGKIQATLDEFVRFARVSRLDPGPVELRSLVERAAPAFEVEGAGEAEGDARKLGEAFADVAAFLAERAVPGGGLRARIEAGRRRWRVTFRGTVRGLDPAALGRLFNPYWRARRNDVGRGLAWAQAILHAHGGTLEARLDGDALVVAAAAPARAPQEVES